MKRKRFFYLSAGIFVLWFFSAPASGEDSKPEAAPPPGGARRNPFSTGGPVLKQGTRETPPPAPAARIPEGMPGLTLRGYIEGSDGTAAALLEAQGAGLFVVRKGMVLSLNTGKQTIFLRIQELRDLAAVVLIEGQGPGMVVH